MIKDLERNKASINRAVGDLDKEDGYNCDLCKNKGYTADIRLNSVVLVNCECIKNRKVLKHIKESGLERQFKNQTFDSFETPEKWQRYLISTAKSYVNAIKKENKKSWFIVSGQVGSGKTHICVAIISELIELGLSVRYVGYATDLRRITTLLRSNYMSDEREKAQKEFYDLLSVDILYIDDYLKVDGKNDFLFEIINTRYISDKITIISTEKDYKEQVFIDSAVASRIYEKAKGFVINIGHDENKNYRLKTHEVKK